MIILVRYLHSSSAFVFIYFTYKQFRLTRRCSALDRAKKLSRKVKSYGCGQCGYMAHYKCSIVTIHTNISGLRKRKRKILIKSAPNYHLTIPIRLDLRLTPI